MSVPEKTPSRSIPLHVAQRRRGGLARPEPATRPANASRGGSAQAYFIEPWHSTSGDVQGYGSARRKRADDANLHAKRQRDDERRKHVSAQSPSTTVRLGSLLAPRFEPLPPGAPSVVPFPGGAPLAAASPLDLPRDLPFAA